MEFADHFHEMIGSVREQFMASRMSIISDDPALSEELKHTFQRDDWQIDCYAQPRQARGVLLEQAFEPRVIVVAIRMLSQEALDELKSLHNSMECGEWIYLIADQDQSPSAQVNRLAFDVLDQPADLERLALLAQRAWRSALTRWHLRHYTTTERKRFSFEAYQGTSPAVEEVRALLKQLSDVPLSTLIITGETGTGKGLVARILHYCGERHKEPLVELNCAALPKELLESQLFGHEAGAFTGARTRHHGLFEQANGGTLFLDEIGDMDLELQAKLLKAIEDKKIRRLGGEREIDVDLQIFAATSVNLEQAAREGKLREDLYHRLSVFSIHLPPLRTRKEDMMDLVPRIVAEFNLKANKKIDVIPNKVWEQLMAYDWPGNIRELRNVIERCVLLSKDEVFPARWLQLPDSETTSTRPPSSDEAALLVPLDGNMALEEIDRMVIQKALKLNNFNVTETARVLGTTRETLRYRIQKYDLKRRA